MSQYETCTKCKKTATVRCVTKDSDKKLEPRCVDHTDYHGDPVHQILEGLEYGNWYFWEESWSERYGPYSSEARAREKLKLYCETHLEGTKPMEDWCAFMDTPKEEEVLGELWERKSQHKNTFAYAELKEGLSIYVERREGFSPAQGGPIEAGTTVLITMVSRFGDVGIRAHHLTPPSNGYDARILPDLLRNLRRERYG